jgi:hypothetical protein
MIKPRFQHQISGAFLGSRLAPVQEPSPAVPNIFRFWDFWDGLGTSAKNSPKKPSKKGEKNNTHEYPQNERRLRTRKPARKTEKAGLDPEAVSTPKIDPPGAQSEPASGPRSGPGESPPPAPQPERPKSEEIEKQRESFALVKSIAGQVEPVSEMEILELMSFEEVVGTGWSSFVDVGLALAQIRDKRLYREIYPTFESYCRVRCQYGRHYVNRLVSAAQVFNRLVTNCHQTKSEHRAFDHGLRG